jgi:hypothetical protein
MWEKTKLGVYWFYHQGERHVWRKI